MIKTPWDKDTIDRLNKEQKRTDRHPYTCEFHSDHSLIATEKGWICPVAGCDYKQNWFHGFV
jgi:hypothetical protein